MALAPPDSYGTPRRRRRRRLRYGGPLPRRPPYDVLYPNEPQPLVPRAAAPRPAPMPKPSSAPKPPGPVAASKAPLNLGSVYGMPSGFSGLTPAEQKYYLDQRRQLLLGFGDPSLARNLLGPTDAITRQLAHGAPLGSTLGDLGQQYGQQVTSTNQGLNLRNLFYSSARSQALNLLQQGYTNQKVAAEASLEGKLSALTDQILGAIGSIHGPPGVPSASGGAAAGAGASSSGAVLPASVKLPATAQMPRYAKLPATAKFPAFARMGKSKARAHRRRRGARFVNRSRGGAVVGPA